MLFIPHTYNIILFKSNNNFKLELYNLKKKIKFPIHKKINFFVDKNTNCITFKKDFLEKNVNLSLQKFSKLFLNINSTFFNKIKFKGKGFRVRFKKKSETLKFTFGHSHINYLFINNKTIKIKRLGKYKYTFKCNNNIKMNIILKKICNIKPINMYTKRGIRKGRQIIFKRKGKKSTYI